MSNEDAPVCTCNTAGSQESDLVKSEPNSGRQCCLKQSLWWLLHSQNFSDVSFVVGPDSPTRKFCAHKSVLSARSIVFRSMFGGDWVPETDIRVPDVEPPAFSVLLRFLYTDDVSLTADSALQVLYAARKYAVRPLERQCSNFLEKQLRPENAFTLLIQAQLFDEKRLVESCLKVIDNNPYRAFLSYDFTSISLALLCQVLKRDTLKILETALFDAVIRWAKVECKRKALEVSPENQKLVLEDAVSLIRFPRMTQKEFISTVAKSGILSDAELVDMFYYFSGCPKASFHFNATPRSEELVSLFNSKRVL